MHICATNKAKNHKNKWASFHLFASRRAWIRFAVEWVELYGNVKRFPLIQMWLCFDVFSSALITICTWIVCAKYFCREEKLKWIVHKHQAHSQQPTHMHGAIKSYMRFVSLSQYMYLYSFSDPSIRVNRLVEPIRRAQSGRTKKSTSTRFPFWCPEKWAAKWNIKLLNIIMITYHCHLRVCTVQCVCLPNIHSHTFIE